MFYAPEISTSIGVVPNFEQLNPNLGQIWSLGVPLVDQVVQLGNYNSVPDRTRLAFECEKTSMLMYREDGKYLQVRNLEFDGPESESYMFENPVPFVRFFIEDSWNELWACADVEAMTKGQLSAMRKFAEITGAVAMDKQIKYLKAQAQQHLSAGRKTPNLDM